MLVLNGQKINLRDYRLTDLDAYTRWNQPGNHWQELDGPYYPVPDANKLQEIVTRIRSRILSGTWDTPRRRLAIVSTDNDALLGATGWYWISQETDWAAAGLSIYNSHHWQKGYGYEALGLWTEYLFKSTRWVRLDLRTWSGNIGMMKLAEKLGYKKEAVFRRARIVKGQYYDSVGYGILREEWEERYGDDFIATLET